MAERGTEALEQYLARLKRARTEAAYLALEDGREGVMRLADLQSAITAVEAVIAGHEREPAPGDLQEILVGRTEIDRPRAGFASGKRSL